MSKFFNNIFISLFVLFLAFCWLMYYTKFPALSFGIALTLSLLCCVLLHLSFKKPSKQEKLRAKKSQLLALQNQLTFSTENFKLFSSVFEKLQYKVEKIDDTSFKASNEQKSLLVAWSFDFEALSSSTVVNFCKIACQQGVDKAIVFSNSASKNAFFVAESAPQKTEIWQIGEVFSLLQHSNLLPDLPEKPKKPPRILLSFALSKKRFAYYLGSAFFLAAFSVISYFPLYNLIWASALFLIALYALLNKRFNTATNKLEI